MKSAIKNIAIFASGSGTNALNICNYFNNHHSIKVTTLVCNKPKAKVIERLQPFNVEVVLIKKSDLRSPEQLIKKLKAAQVDFIVLAGFLLLIPNALIKAFHYKIINLHPSLLPKYGGKGMYGLHVHEAVLLAKEKESGITIHYVNELFDEGEIIFQARVAITESDTAESVAKKINELEYAHYPTVIETVASKNS